MAALLLLAAGCKRNAGESAASSGAAKGAGKAHDAGSDAKAAPKPPTPEELKKLAYSKELTTNLQKALPAIQRCSKLVRTRGLVGMHYAVLPTGKTEVKQVDCLPNAKAGCDCVSDLVAGFAFSPTYAGDYDLPIQLDGDPNAPAPPDADEGKSKGKDKKKTAKK